VFPDDVTLNNASVVDDESVASDLNPPANFLPKGWVLFKTRGPLSFPKENRLDFFRHNMLMASTM